MGQRSQLGSRSSTECRIDQVGGEPVWMTALPGPRASIDEAVSDLVRDQAASPGVPQPPRFRRRDRDAQAPQPRLPPRVEGCCNYSALGNAEQKIRPSRPDGN